MVQNVKKNAAPCTALGLPSFSFFSHPRTEGMNPTAGMMHLLFLLSPNELKE
jgi:hypothetical protein